MAMYQLACVTAMVEGRTRHDLVLGMTGGKFTVSPLASIVDALQVCLSRHIQQIAVSLFLLTVW